LAQKLLPEFIVRDRNHPCVFLWSNGNEGGWNTSVDPLFAELDLQHRKLIHPWSDFEDLDTHHYPAYQTGTYRLHNGQNVFMPTEFLHGKYDKGQGAALEDMWNHWIASPLFAGGFLWAYLDEAVRRTDLPTGKSKGRRFGQKGYRSEMRWMEIVNKDKSRCRVTSLTDNLYFRLFTPEEAIDQTPGEMGGMQEEKPRKQERTMVPFPAGNISFLLSIPPIQSYKPLEQLGPQSQPDNIRIKSGDDGFHIRLLFE